MMFPSEMDSIAYTNLRKEPGMEILPRWVELTRTDRHRVKRMTSQQIRALVIHRKLTDKDGVVPHWRPLERKLGRFRFKRVGFQFKVLNQPPVFDDAIFDDQSEWVKMAGA